jgi:pyruvate formate lyase activating enzyme
VLAGCRAAGIHTAIETCGAGPWETLRRLLDHTDLVLYDLKLIDDVLHREWTGASNRAILANARRLAGRSVRVRVPLIPGVTDTAANLRGLFGFAADAGLREVELLPANEAAAAKYEWLGRPYDVPHKPVADAQLAESIAHGRALGLELTGPAPPAAS